MPSSVVLNNLSPNVVVYNNYHPFGMTVPNRSASSTAYRYGFNGMEKDDELKGIGNSYDFGARMYDPRVGRWFATDPLMNDIPSWSPYSYAVDNPIMYIDVNGEWPGIGFLYFELDVGAGINYGLNYVVQSGIAYDKIGKTHFSQVSALYVVNQNLEDGSDNPQLILGASAGLGVWGAYNWNYDTFGDYSEGSGAGYGVPAGDLSTKAEFGIGLGISSESISVGFGPQIGFKMTVISTDIELSISITDNEADYINDISDIVYEPWILNNKRYDEKNDRWQASVATKNTKGELIDSGTQVYSSNIKDEEGNNTSNGVWQSKTYEFHNEKLKEEKE